ncbi:hypothetical protein [Streptomyces sp. NPDC102437]|uniref:hypothetical protein n=1 Tax=Streptomyces sp. NPDC102437 TaxID=3366175 RepID=UPI0037FFDA5C
MLTAPTFRSVEGAYLALKLASHNHEHHIAALFELYRQIEHEQRDTLSLDVLDALHLGLRWLVGHRWAACFTPGSAE